MGLTKGPKWKFGQYLFTKDYDDKDNQPMGISAFKIDETESFMFLNAKGAQQLSLLINGPNGQKQEGEHAC